METITLTNNDLENIAYGAAFLGCGGGGPLHRVGGFIEAISSNQYSPKLVNPQDLSNDSYVCCIFGIGSQIDAHKCSDMIRAPLRATQLIQEEVGIQLNAIVPAELGALNSIIPFLVSAQTGLPVVDADGAGRSYAHVDMSTFNLVSPVDPYIVCNDASTPEDFVAASLQVNCPKKADEICRGIVRQPAFEGAGCCATWFMKAEQMKVGAVECGISRALALGRLLRPYRERQQDPLEALLNYFGEDCQHLATGKLSKLDHHTNRCIDLSHFEIVDGKQFVTIFTLNENMIAWSNQAPHPLCIAPDSICFITSKGETFSNSEIDKYKGEVVHLIAVRSSPLLRHPKIVERYLDALHKIGYPGGYLSLEQLQEQSK
ncbi:DUF917 domain-containing protein [Algicola sagamiensis]|uniref:DUF917 domain-containing protein n=1 Tax=Algicola sagamiensis TaxID=163869 RepID=UPI00035D74AE|nr:DUF917 domain-containing protein [Algicola sagamiensis]